MLENFIYAKQKSLFEEALNNGLVLDEAIVFIEDTKEIWNHGTYFDGSTVDLSNIETSIQNILDTKADKTEIPTKVSELENDVPYVIDYTIPQGVSIMDASGNIMTAEEWSEDKGLTGLVVSDGTRNVVVAVTDVIPESAADDMSINTLKKWSTALNGVDIEGLDNYDYQTNAENCAHYDFNSKTNTDAILSALSTSSNPSETDNAAVVARNYSSGIYGVGEWDLPACGILNFLYPYRNEMWDVLDSIGKADNSNTFLNITYIWSSTELDANYAATYNVHPYIHQCAQSPKENKAVVIPVKEISVTTLKEKVETLESKIADAEPYILNYDSSWANTQTTLTDWDDKFNELFDVISNNKPILVKYNDTYYTPIASSNERPMYGLSIIGISFEHIETNYDTLKVNKKVHNITFLKDSFGITVKDVSGNELAYKSDIPTKVSELENDVPYAVDSVKYIPQGVSIMDGSGNIITDPSLWNEDLGLTGIVVSNGEHEIVLGLFSTEEEATSTPWSEAALINTDVEGVINYNDENRTGYESTSNTDAIIAALATSSNPDETNNAAVKCRNFSSGIYGVGEWDLPAINHYGMFSWSGVNYESIKNAADYIGKYFYDYGNKVVLCSTEYDADNFTGQQPQFAYTSGFSKSNTGYVLVPIHVITPEEKGASLNDRVTALESNSTLVITQDSDPATIFNILNSGNYSKIKTEYIDGDYTYSGEAIEVVPNESNYSIHFIGSSIHSENEKRNTFGFVFNIIVSASEIELITLYNGSKSSTIYPYHWDGSTINDTIWQELMNARLNSRLVIIGIAQPEVASISYMGSGYPSYQCLSTASNTYFINSYWSAETPYYEVIKINKLLKEISAFTSLNTSYYNKIEVTRDKTFDNYTHIEGYTNEYQGELIFGDTVYTVTFPEEITWVTIPESYKANTTYQFKIINDIGYIWEVGNGEVAYKTEIPTKVSELENDSNYLITESDPVFTASAASGITAENISDWNNKQNKNLYFTNVAASSWVSDSTYPDYPYRCDLACNGVTENMYADVIFNIEQAHSGNYAPICETGTNIVSIWSSNNVAITVLTIIIEL